MNIKISLLLLGLCFHLGTQAQHFYVSDSSAFRVTWKPSSLPNQSDQEHWVKKECIKCFLSTKQASVQPILGTYTWTSKEFHFQSLVEPSPGAIIVCQLEANQEVEKIGFQVPQETTTHTSPKVVSIYPLADSIPENILLFYLTFDQAMNTSYFDYKALKLFTKDGEERPMAWRHEVNWDKSSRVAAIMIHPGRVKQGIDYQEEHGKVLNVGEQVYLEVGRAFQNKWGDFPTPRKSQLYTVTAKDSTIPRFIEEEMTIPPAGSKIPLTLQFSEVMGLGSMLEGVQVLNDGKVFSGTIRTYTNERFWYFEPSQDWTSGEYTLVFNEYPADLAQNTIHQAFELKTNERPNENKKLEVPFEIR